ncbi:hypothetical protein OJAV_G00160320 [Oryzias javanicus]|uniref:Uncharacterized protein n=1 Tax=Oryzias javanicus TaxID=123683 RepID=A0A3S2P2Q7_ORYJA|nr:hypothetical protein OJAV_G00160320 [Oryzias javanicus]
MVLCRPETRQKSFQIYKSGAVKGFEFLNQLSREKSNFARRTKQINQNCLQRLGLKVKGMQNNPGTVNKEEDIQQ